MLAAVGPQLAMGQMQAEVGPMVRSLACLILSLNTLPGQSPTLTRASTQKRREPKVKADREVARVAIQHSRVYSAEKNVS